MGGREVGVITFLASLPPIQSAIKIGSDSMRFQLDVPETEVPNAVEILAMRGKVLKVTIEVADKPEGKPKKGITRFSTI